MLRNPRCPFTQFLPLALSIATLSATDPPGFPTNEDMRHFRNIDDPRLSPNGSQVLFRIVDSTADGARSHLWLADVFGNASRQLTWSSDSDKTGEIGGEWMPDGASIVFIAHRGDHNQIFRLPMNGGEARPFDIKVLPTADGSILPGALPPSTELEKISTKNETAALDVQSFRVSPDGKAIAVIAKDPQTPGEKKQIDAKVDAVWVNHDTHGQRIWLFDPVTEQVIPVAVAADVKDAVWNNSSAQLFVTREEPNEAADLGPATSGWVVDIQSPGKPAMISGLPPTLSRASWSRDDKVLYFLAQAEKDTPPGYLDLFTYDFATRKTRNLTDGFGGSIRGQGPIPLLDGVLQTAATGVTTGAIRINRDGHQIQMEFPTSVTNSFHTNAGQSGWVFLGSSSTQPNALFYTTVLGEPAHPLRTPDLTPTNARSIAPRRIQWKSDSFTIEGLLYLPPEASRHRVPLVVEVHGGPTGAYVDSYDPFVNFLVGYGWAVLRTNPRGSTNYGATFAAANKNDLGGGDYRDIIAGVDFVLKTQPIDDARLALEGYSYGGEMAAFVEGKTTRFKAIVSGAPVIDQYSEYGTESSSWYDRWFYGKPWEHPADAWRQSPLSAMGQAKTPFMLLQGQNDTTDPLGQAQEMYRALRQMGVPVDLITYPRDNHGPLSGAIYGRPVQEPWHGFDTRQRIVRFIQKAFGESKQ